MRLDPTLCHNALEGRDARFDGRFYTGVSSTGIYCRCICSARTPKRENRRFFASAAAAEAGGFRPCMVCRPELAPGLAPIDSTARLAAQAYGRIEAGALEEQGLGALARELGVTDRHLRRAMRAAFGASPIELAQTCRLLTARRLLMETGLGITEIAFASGFQSLRRFNAAMKARYAMSPSRMRGKRGGVRGTSFQLRLGARGALDLAPTFSFLAARALCGVEACEAGLYARVLRFGAVTGWIAVRPDGAGVRLEISEALAPHLRAIIATTRGALDLDADVTHVDAHLAQDARLADDVAREPGVRIAGGFDAFETAVRAILGQQVSVAGARTLAGRLVERFGAPIESAPFGLSRAFPDAVALSQASIDDIAAIGLTRRRAETLATLAQACVDGRLTLARGAIGAGREGLLAICGIGPWTVEYVALRALGDPDAFPTGDSALGAALGDPREALEAMTPWRGYAAMRLWRRAAAKEKRAC